MFETMKNKLETEGWAGWGVSLEGKMWNCSIKLVNGVYEVTQKTDEVLEKYSTFEELFTALWSLPYRETKIVSARV